MSREPTWILAVQWRPGEEWHPMVEHMFRSLTAAKYWLFLSPHGWRPKEAPPAAIWAIDLDRSYGIALV